MKVSFVGMVPYKLNECNAHKHEEWELNWYIEGEGVIYLDGVEYPFKPSTIICQPPETVHYQYSQKGFRDIFVQIKDFISPGSPSGPIVIYNGDERFGTLMGLLFETFLKKEKNHELILQSLLETLYQLLCSWYDGQIVERSIVEPVKNAILNNITNPDFFLKPLLARTGYCPDYFRQLFKQETGYCPTEYLINHRIAYAQKLLSQRHITGYTIKEIALYSGFSDPYYFSRVFRKKTGKSPSEI
ncbi:MAG: helix-turn-helix domain-containing protein [Lentimicrobiaceae bacterium]|nr:helix-turn-helix domain-containing protein [Lentimicrobiaceae bacterium]